MKTVTSYSEVHNMTPIGLPTFSIISDDKRVVTEIRDIDLDSYSITDECISLTLVVFKYLSDMNWTVDENHTFDITLTQKFMGYEEAVELVSEFKGYYLDGYNSFGSSSTRNVTYGYYFYDENTHNRMMTEE